MLFFDVGMLDYWRVGIEFFWLRTALLLGVFNNQLKIAIKLSTEKYTTWRPLEKACLFFFLEALKGSKRNKNKEPIRGHSYFQWLNPTDFHGFRFMVGIEIGYIHQLWHWLDNIQFHGLMDSQFWNRNHMQATVRFSKACCKVCCKVCICMFFFCWSVFVFKAALSCLIPLTRAEIHGDKSFRMKHLKNTVCRAKKPSSPEVMSPDVIENLQSDWVWGAVSAKFGSWRRWSSLDDFKVSHSLKNMSFTVSIMGI